MNLALLQAVATYCKDYEVLSECYRVGENCFCVRLYSRYKQTNPQNLRLFFDMTKGRSGIFMSECDMLPTREFCAPFDKQLKIYTQNAKINRIATDGQNRILRIYATREARYKRKDIIVQFEFTGRHTNVILCDEKWRVIEALRHITKAQSYREVRIGEILCALPQPTQTKPLDIIESTCVVQKLLEAKHKHNDVEHKKQALIARLQARQEALKHILDTLPSVDDLDEKSAQYAYFGRTLFNAMHTIKDFHINACVLKVRDIENNIIELPLPQNMRSLSQVGNWYFNMSKKYHQKARNIHKQIENLREKIAFLIDEIALIKHNDEAIDIIDMARKNKYQTKSDKGYVMFIQGYKIAIGRNRDENQRLLEMAKGDDLWFHIRDIPSAHLIIFCGKHTPPQPIIYQCGAMLCKLYATRYGSGDFVVDYTKRRFVKPTQQGATIYGKYQSLSYRI